MLPKVTFSVMQFGIQGGTIGGDTLDGQLSCLQNCLKASKKGDHILVVGIMVENLKKQTLESAVVNDGEDAKLPIVQFVSSQIAGKVVESPI